MLNQNVLIAFSDSKSIASEAYRILRTNLQFSSFDKEIKTIVVTSSTPGEGKTTTIANLAITIAQAGVKVLLVDTDLRKPRIHSLFGLNNSKGITTLLAQHGELKDYVNSVGINNLDVLKSGPIPPNPSELLGSNAMKNFIQKAKENYDIILLDSAPVGSITDAAVLSAISDGVIFVVNSGKVDCEIVKRAKESLENVKANMLGVVLNNVTKQNQDGYYQYEYYGEEQTEEASKKKKEKKKKEKEVNKC